MVIKVVCAVRPLNKTGAIKKAALVEKINGRAAMVGFPAAVATEVITKSTFLQQLENTHFTVPLIGLVAGAVYIGSVTNNSGIQWGPFGPEQEKLNGRVAMMGLASLLVTEAFTGHALF